MKKAGRQRKQGNKHLPKYLWKEKKRGHIRYRILLKDGTRRYFPIGTTEAQAIQTTLAYNQKHRGNEFDLDTGYMIAQPRKLIKDKFNRPFSEWMPVVWERILNEERLAPNSIDALTSTVNRMLALFGHVYSKDLTLEHINALFEKHYKTASVFTYNGRVSQVKKVFAYLADESAIESNFALNKKPKKNREKMRNDLTIDQFKRIYAIAPLRLQVAMRLTLQTTHVVAEVSRIRYSIPSAIKGACGIVWYDAPKTTEDGLVHGTLYIQRKKVKNTKASNVAFPVTDAIKEIIDLSRMDNVACPYVVHMRVPDPRRSDDPDIDHPLQMKPRAISNLFTDCVKKLPEFKDVPPKERPTYHEIRRLSARMYDQSGHSPTQRMAHNDARTTKVYTDDHNRIDWNEIPAIYHDFDAK